jgi:dihydrodipicolinate synthase/N-acetylneuraminate lyase
MGASEPRTSPGPDLRERLIEGLAIPAHPLALTAERRLDERRQAALTRYYCDAGAGGLAVGVHTTQFAIRDPRIGLLQPVLELAARTVAAWRPEASRRPVMVAGVVGPTAQAVQEAELAAGLGYDAVLVSLAALRDAGNAELIDHCRQVARVRPLFGFYLQPAVGGRVLEAGFWRSFLEIEGVLAIKVAPFDRYRTLDVVHAVAASHRGDVALYTGNDDAIVVDLLTPFPGREASDPPVHFSGGLLGQWAVWTRGAVDLLDRCRAARVAGAGGRDPAAFELLGLGAALTDANRALFDPAHQFAGCIPGIHEVLRRQGLLAGRWCLDPHEELSPGQMEEIDRVLARYPYLADDEFVAEHLDTWMS